MRLLVVNHYAIPPFTAGGTRHYSLAKELIKRGHKVCIIASSFNHSTMSESQLYDTNQWKLEEYDGVPFLWYKTPAYSSNGIMRLFNMLVFSRMLFSRSGIEEAIGTPDIVLGSSPHLFAAFAAEKIAKYYSASFLLEIRDLWPDSLVELGKVSKRHPFVILLRFIEQYLYRKAKKIIALAPGYVKYFEEQGVNTDNVIWIPNGIDLRMIPPISPLQQTEPFEIIYAGSHGVSDGLDILLDSVKHIPANIKPKIKISLYGDGPEKSRLQKRVEKEKIDCIDFYDPLPKIRMYEKMREASAFIVLVKDSPLYRYGISFNKIFDYMAMGRPTIIASAALNNPIENSKGGITVKPDDPQALAEGIQRLFEIPWEERYAMGIRARKYVENEHSFNRLAEKMERAFHQN